MVRSVPDGLEAAGFVMASGLLSASATVLAADSRSLAVGVCAGFAAGVLLDLTIGFAESVLIGVRAGVAAGVLAGVAAGVRAGVAAGVLDWRARGRRGWRARRSGGRCSRGRRGWRARRLRRRRGGCDSAAGRSDCSRISRHRPPEPAVSAQNGAPCVGVRLRNASARCVRERDVRARRRAEVADGRACQIVIAAEGRQIGRGRAMRASETVRRDRLCRGACRRVECVGSLHPGGLEAGHRRRQPAEEGRTLLRRQTAGSGNRERDRELFARALGDAAGHSEAADRRDALGGRCRVDDLRDRVRARHLVAPRLSALAQLDRRGRARSVETHRQQRR